ncbi:MAG: hypothetical protein ACE5I5_20525 [Candidatus Heimdallarchaeota archaeon]
MKFGDVVISVACILVISILISVPLEIALIPALGFATQRMIVSMGISVLLAALIHGYFYAGKIRENRREAISQITLLYAAFLMLTVMFSPAIVYWAPMAEEGDSVQGLLAMNPTTTLSTCDWHCLLQTQLRIEMLLFGVIGFALVSIGLYGGSMLRRT